MSSTRRWAVLATVSAGLLLISVDMTVLYTALPTLTADLGADATEKLWIINAYPLVMAGLLLGAGTLGDRVGHKRMYLIGLGLFGCASLLAAFAPSPAVLIAARAFLAVGAAAMMPATLSLIRTTFEDERERGIAIGVWGSVAMGGAALGPVVGGLLLGQFWWGSVFLINVPVVIGAVIATVLVAPGGSGRSDKPWDPVASAQVMVGLVGVVYAIKEVTQPEFSVTAVALSLVAAVGGFWMFVRRQRGQEYPLIDFELLRDPRILTGVVAAGLAMFATAGIQLVLTQRLQLVLELTPLHAGLLVAAFAAGSLPAGILGGGLLHRVGVRPMISGGLLLAAAGVALVLPFTGSGHNWLIPGLVVTGLGLGAAMVAASVAIVGNAPAHRAGMAASVEEVSYELGSLTGVAVLGSVLTAVYTSTVTLPAGAPEAAGSGMDAALAEAARLPADEGAALVAAANSAFDNGYTLTLVIATVTLAVGAAFAHLRLRGHRPTPDAETAAHGH
ncbi:MFS transporter [Streptomyces sp. SM14]|uniref:MFS transporter n=1 Tax=Streptomyces sp. SM14 TaxID=1736045 RepID=UPI000CD4A34D|nr:MFS transporter [Streptomyces sp. SM14]